MQLSPPIENRLTDIVGLRSSGIFPKDKESSIATLRNWTKLRRILPQPIVVGIVLLLPEISALHLQAIHEPPPDSEAIAGTNEPVIQRVRVIVPLRQQADRSEVP